MKTDQYKSKENASFSCLNGPPTCLKSTKSRKSTEILQSKDLTASSCKILHNSHSQPAIILFGIVPGLAKENRNDTLPAIMALPGVVLKTHETFRAKAWESSIAQPSPTHQMCCGVLLVDNCTFHILESWRIDSPTYNFRHFHDTSVFSIKGDQLSFVYYLQYWHNIVSGEANQPAPKFYNICYRLLLQKHKPLTAAGKVELSQLSLMHCKRPLNFTN